MFLNNSSKRAAIELSIGTVIIIVLAMSMLILGIVLIRSIFTGATESVNTINEKDKNQITNSHVNNIADFSGFKAITNIYQLRYTLYKDNFDSGKSLVIRSEINASSTKDLLESESIFKSIISSISQSN